MVPERGVDGLVGALRLQDEGAAPAPPAGRADRGEQLRGQDGVGDAHVVDHHIGQGDRFEGHPVCQPEEQLHRRARTVHRSGSALVQAAQQGGQGRDGHRRRGIGRGAPGGRRTRGRGAARSGPAGRGPGSGQDLGHPVGVVAGGIAGQPPVQRPPPDRPALVRRGGGGVGEQLGRPSGQTRIPADEPLEVHAEPAAPGGGTGHGLDEFGGLRRDGGPVGLVCEREEQQDQHVLPRQPRTGILDTRIAGPAPGRFRAGIAERLVQDPSTMAADPDGQFVIPPRVGRRGCAGQGVAIGPAGNDLDDFVPLRSEFGHQPPGGVALDHLRPRAGPRGPFGVRGADCSGDRLVDGQRSPIRE